MVGGQGSALWRRQLTIGDLKPAVLSVILILGKGAWIRGKRPRKRATETKAGVMKLWAGLLVVALVAGCGSSSRVDRNSSGMVTRFSSGPISRACLSSDRRARNSQLCGCIQTVANQSLSSSDQRKAASFFKKPQRAQDTKMSKTAADDAFWDRYRAFASKSEGLCRGY